MQRIAIYLLLGLSALSAEARRYVAEFQNGDQIPALKPDGWGQPTDTPSIKGVQLFDPANPVRWILRTDPPPTNRIDAFVEFHNGDRLPGMVYAFDPGDDDARRLSAPPTFLVAVDFPLRSSRRGALPVLRVNADMVRRIVWDGSEETPAQTLRLRNGHRTGYRRVKWQTTGFQVLSESGVETHAYGDPAELTLPDRPFADRFLNEVAALSPRLESRLVQLETRHGLVATASSLRYRPARFSAGSHPRQWFHLVHPAWSEEAFVVTVDHIQAWRYFQPWEIPLTTLAPTSTRYRAPLAHGWPWRRNTMADGATLHLGGRWYGWGIGLHADTTLSYRLPEQASRFRSTLHRRHSTVGSITLDDRPAWTSLTEGAIHPVQVELGPPQHFGLHLQAGHPLHMFDQAEWLEPTLEFDRAWIQAQQPGRWSQAIPAWKDWTPPADLVDRAIPVGRWASPLGGNARYRWSSLVRQPPLILKRSSAITSGRSRLHLSVIRPDP
ncbi:MAG: NPCBM/NEW2 domain-containing protein, partial [Verrucomicrobiota bacterium]